MGLDMYLKAERSFDPASPEAQAVLSAAEVSLEGLQALAQNDPMEEEVYFYLSHWSHQEGSPAYLKAEAVLDAAGLSSFTTEDTGGGAVGYRDGKVFVSTSCLYWRKANAIHSWFVQNCQGGIDECQRSDDIDFEQLAYLRSTCIDALAAYASGDLAKAEEILTPVGGFYFGGTGVDEWWAAEAQRTVEAIERLVNLAIETGGVTFYYESSW